MDPKSWIGAGTKEMLGLQPVLICADCVDLQEVESLPSTGFRTYALWFSGGDLRRMRHSDKLGSCSSESISFAGCISLISCRFD